MKVRTSIAFTMLLLLLSASLFACASPLKQPDPDSSSSDTESVKTSETAESAEPKPAHSYKINNGNRFLSYGFSEGRSWVSFSKDNRDYIGVIDEAGNLVYQVDLKELQSGAEQGTNGFADPNYSNLKVDIGSYVRTSYFEDGTGWIGLATEFSSNDGESTASSWAEPGFIVIDKDGNELFTSNDGNASTELTMLGSGAGMFVIKEHTENFSRNDDCIYVTDSKGNMLTGRIECPSGLNSKFSYLGENIFYCDVGVTTMVDGYVLNMNAGSLLSTTSAKPLVPFFKGKTITSGGCVATPSDYASESAINSLLERMRASKGMFGAELGLVPSRESLSVGDSLASWGEGLIFCVPWDKNDNSAYGWYNLDGRLVVPMPDFGEGVSVTLAGSFSGGYAPLELKGKDGKSYVTVIDSSGKAQYEPMKANLLTHDGRSCYSGPGNSCANGYYAVVLNGSEKSEIADSDGNVLEVGTDDLSGAGSDAILPIYVDSAHTNSQFSRHESLIMGGYSFHGGDESGGSTNARFISLDGKHTIDECYES